MRDYDLKLPFTLKTKTAKLECSISLALAPSSGKVSEKQAFGKSHAREDAEIWRCAFVTTQKKKKKLAHVCTRRGLKRGSSLKPRTMPVKCDRSVRATPPGISNLPPGRRSCPSVCPAVQRVHKCIPQCERPLQAAACRGPPARVWQAASDCRAEASGATSLCTAVLLGGRPKKAEL